MRKGLNQRDVRSFMYAPLAGFLVRLDAFAILLLARCEEVAGRAKKKQKRGRARDK